MPRSAQIISNLIKQFSLQNIEGSTIKAPVQSMVEENPNSDGNFFMLNPWHVVMKLIDYADPDAQVEQDQLSAGFSQTSQQFFFSSIREGLKK